MDVARRRVGAALGSGARDRGVLLALAWTAVPLVAHLVSIGPIIGLSDVVRLALWGTLWWFVGVLVLPTPSRWAVYRADAAALAAGFDRESVRASLERLEADQDDELERSRSVETILHLIPAAHYRLAAVAGRRDTGPSVLAAWHAARMAALTGYRRACSSSTARSPPPRSTPCAAAVPARTVGSAPASRACTT